MLQTISWALSKNKKKKQKEKRRKEAEKSLWKVKTKNQTLLLFYFHCSNLFSIILHVETTNITWYRYPNQQFTMGSYCLVSVIFHPSICGFQIVLFIPFQQPELSRTSSPCLPQKNLLPVSRSNNWVSCKLWTWFMQGQHTDHMCLLRKLLRNKVWSMPLRLSVQLGSLTSQPEPFPLSKTEGFSITQEKYW